MVLLRLYRDVAVSPLIWAIALTTIGLVAYSSLRHALFQSGGWDLGIFDQVLYLISQGEPPISSILGNHILADHAALVFYPLALFYRIFPNVHWLLMIQAIALAIGILPVWHLAKQAGLSDALAQTVVGVYLLYPVLFNVNLADFRPEAIALPALLDAVLTARRYKFGRFCLDLMLIMSCKAVLALTVAAMGLWLLGFEKRRQCGFTALITGFAWFGIATQLIMPMFAESYSLANSQILYRYPFLGETVPQAIRTLLLRPDLILKVIVNWENVRYLGLLLLPIVWSLSPANLAALLPIIPSIGLNLLSVNPAQRSLLYQYSLPAVPFLMVLVIAALAKPHRWLPHRRVILVWAIVTFVFLAQWRQGWLWLQSPMLETWQPMRAAIAQVRPDASVLTDNLIAPHLTHRSLIELVSPYVEPDLTRFEYVLLNARYPFAWDGKSQTERIEKLVALLQQDDRFQQVYAERQVYLFAQNSALKPSVPAVSAVERSK